MPSGTMPTTPPFRSPSTASSGPLSLNAAVMDLRSASINQMSGSINLKPGAWRTAAAAPVYLGARMVETERPRPRRGVASTN